MTFFYFAAICAGLCVCVCAMLSHVPKTKGHLSALFKINSVSDTVKVVSVTLTNKIQKEKNCKKRKMDLEMMTICERFIGGVYIHHQPSAKYNIIYCGLSTNP